MRLFMTATKQFIKELKELQTTHQEAGKTVSLKEIVEEAVFFFWQVNSLLNKGYKMVLIDPDGKKHNITKRKNNDEPGQDKGSNQEDT